MDDTIRRCRTCAEIKPISDFPIRRTPTKNGIKEYPRWQCRDCERSRARKYYEDRPGYNQIKGTRYRHEVQHQLGPGGYDRMLAEQDGKCKICNSDNPGGNRKFFAVDHDHSCCPGKWGCTKCVRGLLCNSCNIGLGAFSDDISKLEGAIAYLRMV